MLYNLFLTGFLEQKPINITIKLGIMVISSFNGGVEARKMKKKVMDKRGNDKMVVRTFF